jgi:hypothetical protein
MESICNAVVFPLVNFPYDWAKSQTCSEVITPAITTACIAVTGGPENIIGDAMCESVGLISTTNCKSLINQGITKEKIGADVFSHKICENIFR